MAVGAKFRAIFKITAHSKSPKIHNQIGSILFLENFYQFALLCTFSFVFSATQQLKALLSPLLQNALPCPAAVSHLCRQDQELMQLFYDLNSAKMNCSFIWEGRRSVSLLAQITSQTPFTV